MINRIRGNYLVAKGLRWAATPVQRVCEAVSRQLEMKVWVNGETVRYGDLDVSFPRDVGVNYCSNIYWQGVDGFEPLTWRVIRRFLSASDVFLDVGSNIGFYSVLARKLRKDLEVHSFEPVPSIYEKNKAFHRANGLPETHIRHAAVGPSRGTAEIFLPVADDALEEDMTATLRRDSWQFEHRHTTFTVDTLTLDDVLEGVAPGAKIFAKIDVEDYELGVFQGAERTLRELRPIMVCEILPRDHGNQETVRLLDDSGYVAYGVAKDCLVRFAPEDFVGHRKIRDFLLLPEPLSVQRNHISYEDLGAVGWPA